MIGIVSGRNMKGCRSSVSLVNDSILLRTPRLPVHYCGVTGVPDATPAATWRIHLCGHVRMWVVML